jgi:hypothetical protein
MFPFSIRISYNVKASLFMIPAVGLKSNWKPMLQILMKELHWESGNDVRLPYKEAGPWNLIH